MRIGSYDPQGLRPYETNAARPAAGKPIKDDRTVAGRDEVNISDAARNLAAEGGPGRTEKPSGGAGRTGKTERAEKRKDSGYYERPEVKKDIARRIADEIMKNSPAEKGNGKRDDNDDDSNR